MPSADEDKARAEALSPERRREIASEAAKERWKQRDQKVASIPEKVEIEVDLKEEKPKGVVAILIGPDNRVWVSETDFNGLGYTSDPDQRPAQEERALKALAYRFFEQSCNPVIASVIEPDERLRFMQRLANRKGFRVIIEPIGYEGSE